MNVSAQIMHIFSLFLLTGLPAAARAMYKVVATAVPKTIVGWGVSCKS